jgi:5S rRNA maturation endonuclease (ribonuclease M5)
MTGIKEEILEHIDVETFYLDYFPELELDATGQHEGNLVCPFHHSPTGNSHLSLNVHDGGKCHSAGCGEYWSDPLSFAYKYVTEVEGKKLAWKTHLKKMYSKYVHPLVPIKAIQFFHKELLENEEKKRFLLEERGIEERMIKYYTLGWDHDNDALTVPIKNEHGFFTDCRKVRFNVPDDQKQYKNLPFAQGHGKGGRLFPYENIYKDNLVLCEGETDAIVLNQHGFNAITTGSANAWKKVIPLFKGKHLIVAFDADEPGQKAANKLTEKLFPVNKSVINVVLPKKGMDITDYFVAGYTKEDFTKLIESSKSSEPRADTTRMEAKEETEEDGDVEGQDSYVVFNSLLALCDPKNHGVIGTVSAKVTAEKEAQYSIPKKIQVHCDMDYGEKCQGCPMQFQSGVSSFDCPEGSPQFLENINTSDDSIMRKYIPKSGAPAKNISSKKGHGCCPRDHAVKSHGKIQSW